MINYLKLLIKPFTNKILNNNYFILIFGCLVKNVFLNRRPIARPNHQVEKPKF